MNDESMFFCTLSNQNKKTISKNEIPRQTTYLNISRNHIVQLPDDLFGDCPKLWNIDMSNNKLKNIPSLHKFTALGILDLSDNDLAIDNLLDIFHLYILHIKLSGNPFYSQMNNFLILPTLLPQVMIIDGIFITDHMKKQAKEYKETISFGEEILKLRKNQYATGTYASVSNSAQLFLGGTTIKLDDPGTFISKNGILLKRNADQPQIERLRFISTFYPSELINGTFNDYFGLALGILSYFWLQVSVDYIPRTICGNYWMLMVRQIEKMEQFQLLLLLLNINELIVPEDEHQKTMWECLAVPYFLQTGEIPTIGSSPRLLLSAFISASNADLPENEDSLIYHKLINCEVFDQLNKDNPPLFEKIFNEILAPLPILARDNPKKGDLITFRNPLNSQNWSTGTIVSCKFGRIYIKLESYILQIPVTSVYWDGRGIWREAVSFVDSGTLLNQIDETIEDKVEEENKINEQVPPKSSTHQIRSKSEIRQIDNKKTFRVGIFNPLSSLRKTGGDRSMTSSLRHTLYDNAGKTNNSSFLTNTPSTSTKTKTSPAIQPTFVTDGSMQRPMQSAAMICEPVKPSRKPAMISAPTRRPNQYVKDVINITFGPEIGNGQKLRKFNVKMENVLTHKSQYTWIAEDEISPEDTRRLVELFKKHIESKYTIIPDM